MKQNTRHNILIQTPRLTLREWEPNDWREAFDYARLEKTCRYMPWGPNSMAQTRTFLRQAMAQRKQRPRSSFEFAVVLHHDQRVIGGCGIRIKDPDLAIADLGYCLHPDHWGKGYGTELASALLDWGLQRLGMHRIWATCDIRNRRSEKVLKKIGMKKEGVLREHLRIRGCWRSSCLYAILSTDSNTRSTVRLKNRT